jgi:hypothetical protein
MLSIVDGAELQFDLGHDLFFSSELDARWLALARSTHDTDAGTNSEEVWSYLWIVNEGTALAVGRQFARGCIFQAFNDCCLSGSIVANNERQRGIELNGLPNSRAEGPDAGDGELINSRHDEKSDWLETTIVCRSNDE